MSGAPGPILPEGRALPGPRRMERGLWKTLSDYIAMSGAGDAGNKGKKLTVESFKLGSLYSEGKRRPWEV